MKKSFTFLVGIVAFCILFYACEKCSEYSCDTNDPNIIGAYCNDGTTSDATGQGACSSHGGVKSWRCEKCE
jgi:hypothetical protein